MNKVILKGRITKDIELKETQATKVSRYTIAVNRRNREETDFISCVSFGTQAEFLQKYFKKGQEIAVVGRLQTGQYDDKDGKRVYTTDVIVEEIDFCGAKTAIETTQETNPFAEQVNDDDLPF